MSGLVERALEIVVADLGQSAPRRRRARREPLPSTCSRSRPFSSSMASPTARPGCPERSRATIASRSGGRARMSGPDTRTARWSGPRTGPSTCTASSRPRAGRVGPPEDRRPRGAHEPASPHAQMTADDDAALEAQQEVLANRFDGLEPQPVHAVGDARDGRPRVRRLGLDALPDQRLETAGRAVQRIAPSGMRRA